MRMSEKLVLLRAERDLTQQQLAKIAGVSDKAVSTWENDARSPKLNSIQRICDYFGLNFNSFIDESKDYADATRFPANVEPLRWGKPVPLVGSIACGTPILAEENITDYVDVPEHIQCDFALKCQGNSMIDLGVKDGDVVYIRSQPEVHNGQVAAVIVDGMESEATLKKFFKYENHIMLIPANSEEQPFAFYGEDMARVHVQGLAVGFTHVFEQ